MNVCMYMYNHVYIYIYACIHVYGWSGREKKHLEIKAKYKNHNQSYKSSRFSIQLCIIIIYVYYIYTYTCVYIHIHIYVYISCLLVLTIQFLATQVWSIPRTRVKMFMSCHATQKCLSHHRKHMSCHIISYFMLCHPVSCCMVKSRVPGESWAAKYLVNGLGHSPTHGSARVRTWSMTIPMDNVPESCGTCVTLGPGILWRIIMWYHVP